jgi:lipopolysaccharide exporter
MVAVRSGWALPGGLRSRGCERGSRGGGRDYPDRAMNRRTAPSGTARGIPPEGAGAEPPQERIAFAGALDIEDRIPLEGRSLRQHTARGVIINSAFQIGFAVLGLLRMTAVAAFLSASEFGFWGILVTALITLGWLKQIGINDKYVQQDEPDQELAFQKAFTLELAYTVCFYALVLVALPVYALIYGRGDIIVPGLILSLAFLASAWQAPIWIAYRQMRFVRQRTLEAIDPVLSTVVMIALAASGLGYWSLVIGTVAGGIAAAIVAVATCPYRLAWRFDRTALREYFSFSWPLFLSGLSGIMVVQGSVLIGNYTVGLAGLGALALANSFAAFADRVDQVIRQTIYPAACAVQDRRDLLFEMFEKSNRLALMWALPFGIGLALFAPDLITYVLGERWRLAEGLLAAFGLILGFRQVAFNWTVFLRAVGYTRPIFINSVVLAGSFAVVTAPLMFAIGLDGYALGMGIVLVLDLALRGYFLARLFEGFHIGRHLVRAVAPSVPATLVILALHTLETGERSAAVVVGELGLYVLVTAVATWLLERPLIDELLGYLRGPRGVPRPAPS